MNETKLEAMFVYGLDDRTRIVGDIGFNMAMELSSETLSKVEFHKGLVLDKEVIMRLCRIHEIHEIVNLMCGKFWIYIDMQRKFACHERFFCNV